MVGTAQGAPCPLGPAHRARNARIFSAARKCGLSIILPSIFTTPETGLSLKALTIFSDQAISSSVGMKAALTTSTCLGWITALAKKPSCRAAIDSAQRLEIVDVGSDGV